VPGDAEMGERLSCICINQRGGGPEKGKKTAAASFATAGSKRREAGHEATFTHVAKKTRKGKKSRGTPLSKWVLRGGFF